MQYVVENMKLNGWSFVNLSENVSREVMKVFDYFYYVNGRFLTKNNLIGAPDGQTPDLSKSNQEITPDFTRTSELVKRTNSSLPKMVY